MNTATAENKIVYTASAHNFSKIPGSPIAYWATVKILEAFSCGTQICYICEPKQGLITGDNERFLRFWFEVSILKCSIKDRSNKKWYPINKGGEFRKWYGNQEYVVNWENNGYEIQNFKDKNGKLRSRPQNLNYNFHESVSWSLITSGKFSVRYYSDFFTFNVAGISCFPCKEDLYTILAFLNSNVVENLTKIINPTLNMNVGDIARIPVIRVENNDIKNLATCCMELARADWDAFETSWDFKKHPLI